MNASNHWRSAPWRARARQGLGRLRALSTLALACAGLAGCITVPEFQALKRDVEALKRGGSGSGAASAGPIPDQNARLAELGYEVESLRQELADIRGELEEARHAAQKALAEVEDLRAGGAPSATPGVPAPGVPTTGAPLVPGAPIGGSPAPATAEVRQYEEAFRLYRAGDYRQAIARFEAFLESYPDSEYADNALFWTGECHSKLGDFELAAVTFDRVAKQYPRGNKVPDALYRQGVALLEIGQRSGQDYSRAARQIFERIISDHPDSDRVAEARRQLEKLRQ